MANHGRCARDHRAMILELGQEMSREQHRDCAFCAVEDQRRRGKALSPGAQHVRRTDIARTNLAQVARPKSLGQQNAKGNRTEQIARRRQQ